MKQHSKIQFQYMDKKQIKSWIDLNKHTLVGSAIFTCNKSFVSKVVSWAENWGEKNKKRFTPSHTGSIIRYRGDIYLFDMKPLKAKVTLLADYMASTKDDYIIVMRDFKLNGSMFSKNIAERIGQPYPYSSAIRSVFNKRETKWKTHCSELHLRELQKQGIFNDLNPECTPNELYHEMID